MENNFVGRDKSGIVLVNKPTGISSNKVVNIVKHALRAKKCGHLGTLDLEGAGLLPVTVNNATKLFDYFLNKTKTYETVFVFGFETDTLDTSGEIIKQKECHIERRDVEKAIKEMIGKYDQMPPIYSAKKVGGKIAYKEARKGQVVELKPKTVEIFDFKLLEQVDENVFKFLVECSSGTYIRSLCRDLAEKLSTYGSMQCILRTKCGMFDLKEAYSLDDIENGKFDMISCEEVFDYENLFVSSEETSKLLNGQILKIKKENGKYKIYDDIGFVGIGEIQNGQLKLTLRL